MAVKKYRVLKPIEYGGKNSTMYYPADHWGRDPVTKKLLPCPFKTTASGCHGDQIPIDSTGVIELPDDIAIELNLGQIAPLDPDGLPYREGYDLLGRALAAEQVKRGTEDKVETAQGKEEWVSGAPREVAVLGTEGTMKVGTPAEAPAKK